MSLTKKLGALTFFYLFFAMFYMLSLRYSYAGNECNWRLVYLDYPLKALVTLPVWWLIFRGVRQWSFLARIGLTLLLLPLWTKGWQQLYYFSVDSFFTGDRLRGNAEWWDIYIPALFYCIQFGLFFAVEYYYSFKESLLAKTENEKLLLASELSALKAQLNPHFLYNAFNTISASVPPREEQTRELIAHLSDMFRYQLKVSDRNLITLDEEIAFVQDYLTLEKARFGERLDIDIKLPQALRQAALPPLILQPLVENAVKHGIAPLVKGGLVTIEARRVNNDQLQLRVSDNGSGFSNNYDHQGNGMGLNNIRRRLELLYQSELDIATSASTGSHLSFIIPLTYVTQDRPDRRRITRPQAPQRVPD